MEYYHIPSSVEETLSIADNYSGNYTYFAGGTDIQIYRKQKLDTHDHIIDLSRLDELKSITVNKDHLHLGAMTTLDDIISSDIINSNYPLISEAAKSVATPVIRKTATIGGNLLVNNRCTFYNQSKEWRDSIGSCLKDTGDICQVTGGNKSCYARNVSDTAAALVALGSEIIFLTPSGSIQKPLTELYLPCGIKSNELDEHSILTGITIPIKAEKWWYRKLRLRKTLDFTSLTVAATVDSDRIARICLNGVSMSPVLIKEALKSLTLESLIKQARKKCKTVENDLMPLKYRREMINVYLKECWETLH